MNPLLQQLLLVAIGGGIGALVKHLWPTAPTTPVVTPTVPVTPSLPTTPTTPVAPSTDPFKGLPGFPGHPVLNSPVTLAILQQLEAAFMNGLQAQVAGIVAGSGSPALVTPPKS